MKKELEKKLFEAYPKIFAQKDMRPQETCLCWGISTGNGWYKIIDKLCSKIQKYVDSNEVKQVQTVQVKEKFGGLRFYVDGAPEEVYKYIYEAEGESLVTCEECGSKDRVKQSVAGWTSTLCHKCMEGRNAK